nr:hypothetical protein [Methanobacterium formicicum]
MKETSFAVVIVTFLAFLGVLSGIVLLADNETSILEDAGSFFKPTTGLQYSSCRPRAKHFRNF